MLGDAIRNLRLDRRLAKRRGWIEQKDLDDALEALPDTSANIAPEETDEVEENTVLATDPEAGTRASQGETVRMTVAGPPKSVQMPGFIVGLPESEARATLEAAPYGFQVTTAETAEDALDQSRRIQPDLILMDVVLPGVSGYQATRALRRDKSTKGIPIFICSSRTQESDKVWGLRQGAREYVTKPVNPNVLLTAISEAVAA